MMQQMMQMLGGGKATGKGGYGKAGKTNFEPWGGSKGGAKGMKGKGKGMQAMGSWEDPCKRCGGKHLASQCSYLTNGKTCHKCGRTGHAANCCTSKKFVDDEICKGCGEKGHIKKECQAKLDCNRCKKKGHTEKVCTQPANYKPPNLDQRRQAGNQDAGSNVCRPCGENELSMIRWQCSSCEKNIRDDNGTATKCPSCHTARENPKVEAAPRSLLPQCKATTERDLERAQKLDMSGALPPTPTMQEAIKEAQQLQKDIDKLEDVAGAEEVLATKKKKLETLKPKLPVQDQASKDHAGLRLSMQDVAEKRTMGEKDIKEKIAQKLDSQAATQSKLAKDLKALETEAAKSKKILEDAARKKGEQQAAELASLHKDLEDIRREAEEKEKTLAAAVTAVAPAVAVAALQVGEVTMVPTVAGHIIHSNDVSPEQLHTTAMSSPLLQGITPEQSSAFIQVILTALQAQATRIAPTTQQTDAAGANLQVHQQLQQDGQPVEEDEWTDGDMDEDEKDLEEVNRKEGDVLVKKKKRILKSQKKLVKTNAK